MAATVVVASSASHSVVDQFINDAREDFVSPTTSVFFNRVNLYRQHAQLIYDNLDYDVEGLQKFRKSVKALHESGSVYHESEQDLVGALDALANVNAANSLAPLAQDYDPDISAAWLKFYVIFNDLSKLTKSLVQSVKNNLLFPVDNLLKTDLKDKGELKKPVDKALRDFDAKVARLEKELKHSSREGANGRLYLSSTDLAESMLKERTVLELELCKFFHGVSKIQSKKGSELLQHLIAFYHTQESFYREGLRTVEEFRCYVDTLIDQLNDINRKQEEERKRLRKLSEMFESSASIKEISDKMATKQSSGQALIHSFDGQASSNFTNYSISESPNGHHDNRAQSPRSAAVADDDEVFSGYLYKKGKRKMHRHWMKRKCEARQGRFYVWHSNESQPPHEINLLTCQVTAHKDDPKEFYVISYERKYHFQAEDELSARQWLKVLKRNQDAVQNRTFLSDPGATTPASNQESRKRQSLLVDPLCSSFDVQKAIVERIRLLPGNDRCCDCDSDKDITWVSTNLGSLHCIDCSGGHRDLGCHVSRIQSLTLDNLDKASVIVPLSVGNKAVNEIYEATPSAARDKLTRTSTGNARKLYIANKYGDKMYVTRGENAGDTLESYLFYAIVSGCVKKTLHALALGVDVNAIVRQSSNISEDFQETALFVAIRHDSGGSHLACIQLLIQNGADVNKCNVDGDTPMHVCVRLNKPECLKLVLLSRNADLKSVQANLKEVAHRLERNGCENVLAKAMENDRNALTEIELPGFLLPLASPRRPLYVDSDDASMTSSTLSIGGNSPRLVTVHQTTALGQAPPPPQPPPLSLKPRIPSLHGNDHRSAAHKRSASDSSGGISILPGARLVLPPLPLTTQSSLSEEGSTNDVRSFLIVGPRGKNANSELEKDPRITRPANADEPPPKPAPRKVRPGTGSRLMNRCRALYDCQADRPDELSFRLGDAIIVTQDRLPDEDTNWMEGYVENDPTRLGVFPVTFVTFET